MLELAKCQFGLISKLGRSVGGGGEFSIFLDLFTVDRMDIN